MPELIFPFAISAAACAGILALLARVLPTDFLAARQNARSNHMLSARQIGGLALIPAIILTLFLFRDHLIPNQRLLYSLTASSLLLWIVGFLDDRLELPVAPRILAQVLAALLGAYGLGTEVRLLPEVVPATLEFILIALGLLACINITNFMDGLDWMAVSGLGIPLAGAAVLALISLSGIESGGIAAILAGSLAGFAYFNKPPARIFLGDSGSLPLGLLSATAFILLARQTSIIVAGLLPLYYLMDAGTTLAIRARDGENILAAHSRHAYQVARRAGCSVFNIVGSVARLNVFLLACAIAFHSSASVIWQVVFAALGMAATAWQLIAFRKTSFGKYQPFNRR